MGSTALEIVWNCYFLWSSWLCTPMLLTCKKSLSSSTWSISRVSLTPVCFVSYAFSKISIHQLINRLPTFSTALVLYHCMTNHCKTNGLHGLKQETSYFILWIYNLGMAQQGRLISAPCSSTGFHWKICLQDALFTWPAVGAGWWLRSQLGLSVGTLILASACGCLVSSQHANGFQEWVWKDKGSGSLGLRPGLRNSSVPLPLYSVAQAVTELILGHMT